MSEEEIRRQAAEIGLDLTGDQLVEFARATALARHLADLVPHDPPFAQEPALTLRLERRVRR